MGICLLTIKLPSISLPERGKEKPEDNTEWYCKTLSVTHFNWIQLISSCVLYVLTGLRQCQCENDGNNCPLN